MHWVIQISLRHDSYSLEVQSPWEYEKKKQDCSETQWNQVAIQTVNVITD